MKEYQHLLVFNCESHDELSDHMRIVSRAISENIELITIKPEFLTSVWSWVENHPIKINVVLEYSGDINEFVKSAVFYLKNGANGVEINLPKKYIEQFIFEIKTVRDELFHNKDFIITLNLKEYEYLDWLDAVQKLNDIKIDVLNIAADKSLKTDFMGRVYTMLLDTNFENFREVHFNFKDDLERIESTWRLIESESIDIQNKIRFFINPAISVV